MVNYISGLVAAGLYALGAAIVIPMAASASGLAVGIGVAWFLGASAIASSIKLAAQWEKGVVFRLGRFKSLEGPGLFLILPLIDQVTMVDTRVLAIDIPRQQVITKDNVPVSINGVLFFRVTRADDAIIRVQNYQWAISQYAQTSLRDVIGQMTLDQLLTEREEIGKAIEAHVERDTERWGLEVTGIRIQDLDMPDELKKMMSRQASAEREKRATITKAEGDRDAALNLAAAARTMAESPGAMQLRTLQTIDGLGPTASNTVVLAVPVDILQTVKAIGESMKLTAASETPVIESGDQRKQIASPTAKVPEQAEV